jgi:RNA recognition motif-containing protein
MKASKVRAHGSELDRKDCHIFVKGFLKANWTHEDLHNAFAPFGKIASAKVSITNEHVCKGYGYIQFEDEKDAAKAREEVKYLFSLAILMYLHFYKIDGWP